MKPLRVVLSGQDPSLPGGMAKYVGAVQTYLCAQEGVQATFLNETRVKRRQGMTSSGLASALVQSGRLIREFDRTLRSVKPDVVHLHVAYGPSVIEKGFMTRQARRRNVPVVLHVHGSRIDADIARWGPARRRWLARSFAPPEIVIALTQKMSELIRSALPGTQVSVLPNAVDLVSPPPPLELDPPCVGFIGFIDGRKGELDLLQALSQVRSLEWTAQIAGDGSGMARAKELAKSLGLCDRVHFLGFIEGETKDRFFRSIDLLCLPSEAENLPISLLEAMAYGRPVIASDVGGIPELIDPGVQGVLVPPKQPERLAEALAGYLSSPEDIKVAGDRAWSHIQEGYTWEVVGPKLLGLYRQAIAGG